MVNYGSILSRPQNEINRQFYEMLVRAEAGDASAIQALANKIGDETTANTILKRLKDVETTVGNADSGLVKAVATNTSAIGKASGEGAGGILKDIADIKAAIGDEETSGTILYRIKTLEDG